MMAAAAAYDINLPIRNHFPYPPFNQVSMLTPNAHQHMAEKQRKLASANNSSQVKVQQMMRTRSSID